MLKQLLLPTTALLAISFGADAVAQNPAAVTTPSTVTESVRSTTEGISGAARESVRPATPANPAKATEKAKEAVRQAVPVDPRKPAPTR